MEAANYNNQLHSIYQNMLMHHQSMTYANLMVSFSPVPAPIVKVEPSEISAINTTTSTLIPSPGSSSPCPFSLDTEIPREEIEGDIEVIMVKNFQDNLKKLETTLNGLRGKKFGYRELLDISQTRPTYSSNTSTTKRNRSSSFGSVVGSPHSINSALTHVEHKDAKKVKMNSTIASNASTHDDSFSSDDGRLMIDWNENETEIKAEAHPIKQEMEVPVDVKSNSSHDEYKPSTLRFERLKSIQKKKPRFNVDNLDLTYHSNMARNFPGTENRTEEQQQRRDKNTLAARISRNKNKAYEKILEQQSMDATVENINLKRQIACLRVYANSLMKLSGLADTDFSKMWEANIKEMVYEIDD